MNVKTSTGIRDLPFSNGIKLRFIDVQIHLSFDEIDWYTKHKWFIKDFERTQNLNSVNF